MHVYKHTYVHCYLFLFDYPCVNIVLFMTKDTPFFCKNKIFEPKGFSFSKKKKKKFYDNIVFIHLRICIHMYTNIHIRNITLFFQPFTCKYCTFHGNGHLQLQLLCSFFFFSVKIIFQPKAKKKRFAILKENKQCPFFYACI